MKRIFAVAALLLITGVTSRVAMAQDNVGSAVRSYPAPTGNAALFPVAPHDNVTIEWWYLYSHLTTAAGHHLSIITAFFRFGNAKGMMAEDSEAKVKQSHYMIYAVTDEDRKTHDAYSLGDRNTLDMLTQVATVEEITHPGNKQMEQLLSILDQGKFPPPTDLIAGDCHVTSQPFAVHYGDANTLSPVPGHPNAYLLRLSGPGGKDRVNLTFRSARPPMYVNGDGNTGLRTPTDMKYVSLTNCHVSGSFTMPDGSQTAISGPGWFDHQWGDTWTTQTAGWDWFGVQLADKTDINFFRQRDLKTGKIFFPLATFQDASGKVTVTRNIVFTPDMNSLWTSSRTGITYPLEWKIDFPDLNTTISLTPTVLDQEIPTLSNGGAIWEGSCKVDGTVKGISDPGMAYMELVGYSSAAVRSQLGGAGSNK